MGTMQRAQQEMSQYPKATKIFMFVMFVVMFGFFGFWAGVFVHNITELFFMRIVGIIVGLGIGALLGYVICLKSLFNTEHHNYENRGSFIDFNTEERLWQLDKRARRRRLTFQLIMGIWGISLVVAILVAMTTNNRSVLAFGIAYFAINIVLAIVTVTVISKMAGTYSPKNPTEAEGIVTGSMVIGGGGNRIAHRVSVAVLPINKLLTAYVIAPGPRAPFDKHAHVIIIYNPMRPRKCRIIELKEPS
ncbi:MAG: hypothetical protein FWE38_00200 [Firmicutes bacterium]|nr:hypothetical protein [Bacillota bacterium]